MTTARAPSKIIPRAFPGIKATEVDELVKASQLKDYPAGTTLCREGELEYTFYLILEGEVEVTKIINNKDERFLKTLGPGDFFGEMALIHNSPRAATVRTKSNLIALEISKESFGNVLQNSPSISLAMVREISRRLQENDEMAIDDLRVRASELAEAYQRMAEMDAARHEFLTTISHELRTPLMSAGGYLQMLQKKMIPADKVDQSIETVSRNVQQITNLVNDILFLQEVELILEKFEPVSLLPLVRQVADLYEEKAVGRNIKIRMKHDLIVPPVNGDRSSLERALSSLLDNAIKFNNDGGEVEIALRRKADQVVLSVADTGIGIAPEILPHIFDRFYHLDKNSERVFEGLGIGLAIAKQVINQHAGVVEVQSTPGQGSTFTIKLKAHKGNHEESNGRVTL